MCKGLFIPSTNSYNTNEEELENIQINSINHGITHLQNNLTSALFRFPSILVTMPGIPIFGLKDGMDIDSGIKDGLTDTAASGAFYD